MSFCCASCSRQHVSLIYDLPCILQAVFLAVVALGPGCRGCPRCHTPQRAGDLPVEPMFDCGTSPQADDVAVHGEGVEHKEGISFLFHRADSLSPAVVSMNSVRKCPAALPRCRFLASVRADALLGGTCTNLSQCYFISKRVTVGPNAGA